MWDACAPPTPERGGGKSLVIGVNGYLLENNKKGLLFCKQGLLSFYSKYNWKLVQPERVFFNIQHESVFTMVFNCDDIDRLEYSDRFI